MACSFTHEDIRRGLENGTLGWGDVVWMEEQLTKQVSFVPKKANEPCNNTICLSDLPSEITIVHIMLEISKHCKSVARINIPPIKKGKEAKCAFISFKNSEDCVKTIRSICSSKGLFFGKKLCKVELPDTYEM